MSGPELFSVTTRETRYLGRRFVYPYDSAIGQRIARGEEWDAVLRTEVSALLPGEQPTICEVGSNIGASLLQILAVKPHARVVAFEPSARFRPFLVHNLQLAGFDQVDVFPQALGREPGSMWLYNQSTTASAADLTDQGYEWSSKDLVTVTTLDQVLHHDQPVDLVKIDTDGFDFEVLLGAEATLRRHRPILHFECIPSRSAIDGLNWLQRLGYARLACLGSTGQLVGITEAPRQVMAWAEADASGYCDVVSCPEGSLAEKRLVTLEFS